MKNLKIYQLNNIQQCPFKGCISQFNFTTDSNKALVINKAYKEILRDYKWLKQASHTDIENRISELLDDNIFLTTQEKEIEITVILKYLMRYKNHESKTHRKSILDTNLKGSVKINDDINIEVSADLIFENDNSIELVKYKTSATELSYKARTEKNLPQNNIELYLMKKLGEEKYSKLNKPIIASFYHMKGKNDTGEIFNTFIHDEKILHNELNELKSTTSVDKKEQKKIDKDIKTIEDILYFNNSQGMNVITYDYNTDLTDNIIQLILDGSNINANKCISADCEMCSYSTLCKHDNETNNIDLSIIKNEITKSDGELRLTENQKKVVDVEEGNYRINSVAGSGKSTTMVTRTIELFKKGYSPKDILMITFTNKGCQELKDKIKYWLNRNDMNINIDDLNIFTFNSFGGHIISDEWEQLGFTQIPQIASTIDTIDIIKEIVSEHELYDWLDYKNPLINYPNAKGVIRQLMIYFNMIKSFNYVEGDFINNNIMGNNLTQEESTTRTHIVFEMYKEFNEKLLENNLIQYQDQILYVIQLFQEHEDMINKYGYAHIVVDEYQDTDFTQVELLHLLQKYSNHKSLMVVGDNSQSIYSFRNTTPKNILEFDKQFDDVKDIFLLENFRSTPQICSVANELDKINTQRIDKDIISKKDDGDIPVLIHYPTLDIENNNIISMIQEKIASGYDKNDICYIARTKKELLAMKELLTKQNIPSVIEASELYTDNVNIQLIINLAKFFKDTSLDYYLLEYIVITNKLNNKEVTNGEMTDIISKLKEEILIHLKNIDDKEYKEEDDSNKELDKIQYFYNIIQEIYENDDIAKIFIDKLQEKTFYTFNSFLSYLQKIKLYNDDTSIEKDENNYDAVILTTAHSSKGKEWRVVINSINNYKYEGDIDSLEEERRLLFVSITRAKQELYITYSSNEDKSRNKGKYCLFADELTNVKKIIIEK